MTLYRFPQRFCTTLLTNILITNWGNCRIFKQVIQLKIIKNPSRKFSRRLLAAYFPLGTLMIDLLWKEVFPMENKNFSAMFFFTLHNVLLCYISDPLGNQQMTWLSFSITKISVHLDDPKAERFQNLEAQMYQSSYNISFRWNWGRQLE